MPVLGLRGKSISALLLACLIALLPAAVIGWQLVDGIHRQFGESFARNTTLLQRERIFAPLSRELALSLRLANSEVTRRWLRDETNPTGSELFFHEAEGYRRDFRDQSWFVISAHTHHYYFNDTESEYSEEPRYTLNPEAADDQWYFNTLRDTRPFNINVNHDSRLGVTKAWINVLVRDDDTVIGVAGTGLDLSTFLDDFIRTGEAGVTPMILDRRGIIQAHPDPRLIALGSATRQDAPDQGGLAQLLVDDVERQALLAALQTAESQPGEVTLLWVRLQGSQQLLALSFIPELGWHVATAVDLYAARVIDTPWLTPMLVAMAVLLAALLLAFVYAVERLVLQPIRQLQQSAQAIAEGRYAVALPSERDDEIGKLSAAFGVMADKVRRHTRELEQRVRERTHALEQANREMSDAHQKINDSIHHASQIQRALLPDRQLVQALGERFAVLWQPRDVVGGDFYVYHAGERSCLLGVVDCAGHGVPGALMTMLAHATIDQAIADVGIEDPAGILARCDRILRGMLQDDSSGHSLATNMDIGLAHIDLEQRQVTFAGAKIALYHSDGDSVKRLPGGRRAIGDKRSGEYHNAQVALSPGRSFYLATDGILDQAGGELGYGFGNSRFIEMIQRHARLPLATQGAAFSATLAEYQGDYPQRDDITILCFRFD